MRVRCSSCGAEYETVASRAALGVVARCEHCGRTALHAVDSLPDEPKDTLPGRVARRADDAEPGDGGPYAG